MQLRGQSDVEVSRLPSVQLPPSLTPRSLKTSRYGMTDVAIEGNERLFII